MIDVERLQRLNQLANDLLEHGFAQDREDALRQADETLRKRSTPGVSIMRMQGTPSLEEGKNGLAAPLEASPEKGVQAPSQGFTPDWHMLYRNLKKMVDEQNSHIHALIAQIRQMDAAITSLRNRAPAVIGQTSRQSTQAPPTGPPAAPEQQPLADRKQSVNVIDADTGRAVAVHSQSKGSPRTGGYSPKDVAIEKMFYSGTRPKG